MPLDVLTVEIDGAEARVAKDRITALWDGRDFDMARSTVFRDPVGLMGMFTPLPFTATWRSSASGNYARLTKAEYSLTTASKWAEHHLDFGGDIYLQSLGDISGELVQTLASYPKDQAFWVSFFEFNTGQDRLKRFECGWGTWSATESERDLMLRFWTGGEVEIWRGSTHLGNARITPQVMSGAKDTQQPYQHQTPNAGETGAQQQQTRVAVAIIPCRGRQLLFLSRQGGGSLFTLPDIGGDEQAPTVARAGHFYWNVPDGAAQAQVAPLRYATSGTLLTAPRKLSDAPSTGASGTLVLYKDDPVAPALSYASSLYNEAGSGAFTPDGSSDVVRGRLAITGGDGTSTPFIYGIGASYDPEVADTADAAVTVDDFLIRCELGVTEDPTSQEMNIILAEPDALTGAGLSHLLLIGNRSYEAKIGGVTIFKGRTASPEWEESVRDTARTVRIAARDHWKVFEQYNLRDPVPLDGLNLADAFEFIALLPGAFTVSDLAISPIDFDLPSSGGAADGDWALLMKVGDTPAEWLQKLWDTYCRTHYMGWTPTAAGMRFRVAHKSDIGSAVVKTLYERQATAVAAGYDASDWFRWSRAYRETALEPEANQVFVTGRDKRSGKPIQARYNDRPSQEPSTPPAARPNNWLGEVRRFGWIDASLASQAACNRVAGMLADRLTVPRRLVEFESDFLIKGDGSPVWKGDVVELYGYGRFRVLALRASFDLEAAAAAYVVRPTTYTAEYESEYQAAEQLNHTSGDNLIYVSVGG